MGERYDASIPLPSYFVVDASARFRATDKLALTLKADNLQDEVYPNGELLLRHLDSR